MQFALERGGFSYQRSSYRRLTKRFDVASHHVSGTVFADSRTLPTAISPCGVSGRMASLKLPLRLWHADEPDLRQRPAAAVRSEPPAMRLLAARGLSRLGGRPSCARGACGWPMGAVAHPDCPRRVGEVRGLAAPPRPDRPSRPAGLTAAGATILLAGSRQVRRRSLRAPWVGLYATSSGIRAYDKS